MSLSPELCVDAVMDGTTLKRSTSTKYPPEVETKVYEHLDRQDIFDGEDANVVDPVYQAKARVLNAAFQEMGMGRYQVRFLATDVRLGLLTGRSLNSGGFSSSLDSAGSRECKSDVDVLGASSHTTVRTQR